MPVLKAPPKLIRNATIQVRVEEEIDSKLRKYAEFIGSTPAFVVAESLKLVFNKDAEFREWLAQHGDQPGVSHNENLEPRAPARVKPTARALFDDAPQRAMTK